MFTWLLLACPSFSKPSFRPLCERRKFLRDNMVEIPNRILFSEMKHVTVSSVFKLPGWWPHCLHSGHPFAPLPQGLLTKAAKPGIPCMSGWFCCLYRTPWASGVQEHSACAPILSNAATLHSWNLHIFLFSWLLNDFVPIITLLLGGAKSSCNLVFTVQCWAVERDWSMTEGS